MSESYGDAIDVLNRRFDDGVPVRLHRNGPGSLSGFGVIALARPASVRLSPELPVALAVGGFHSPRPGPSEMLATALEST